jgi:hypothetical protein
MSDEFLFFPVQVSGKGLPEWTIAIPVVLLITIGVVVWHLENKR